MAKECFCGCGRTIPRFPLGMRAINTRGKQVSERLEFADQHDARSNAELKHWREAGDRIKDDLAAALHGDIDAGTLDEGRVREWQAVGRQVERDIKHGRTGLAGSRRESDMSPDGTAGETPEHYGLGAARLARSIAQRKASTSQVHDPAKVRNELRTRLCERAGVLDDGSDQEAVLCVVAMAELGGELLLRLAQDPEFFPAPDDQTRRDGMRLLSESLGRPHSIDASIFLAHALATYMSLFFARVEAEGNDTVEGVGDSYLAMRDRALAPLFPLSEVDQLRLRQCTHVFRAFDSLSTATPPPSVPGFPTAHYIGGTAIELHGDRPDQSPEEVLQLLQGTRRSAEWHFRTEAAKHAIHIAVGSDMYAQIAEGMDDAGILSVDLARQTYFGEVWSAAFEPFRDLTDRFLGSL